TTEHDTDVWAIYREGGEVVITKLFWRGSKLVGSHHFDFEQAMPPTDELLESFIVQHYLAKNGLAIIPAEILLAHAVQNPEAISAILSEVSKKKVELSVPLRGKKKKLCEIAQINAEAVFKQRK